MNIEKVIREIEKRINEKQSALGKYIKAQITELQEIIKKENNHSNIETISNCLDIIAHKDKELLNKRKIIISKKLINQTSYILMLSMDYEKTLQLDKNLIHEISDSMTGVYYENYRKCLEVFSSLRFSEVLNALYTMSNEGGIDYFHPFLKNMVEQLNTKEIPYINAFINLYIREFIEKNNIQQSAISNKGNHKSMFSDSDKKKHFIREIESIVTQAAEVNKIIHSSLIKKSRVLKEVPKIKEEDFNRVMDYFIYLHDTHSSITNFHRAAYTLNLIELQKYLDLSKKDLGELHDLMMKYNRYDYDDYKELFQNEQLGKHTRTF